MSEKHIKNGIKVSLDKDFLLFLQREQKSNNPTDQKACLRASI